MKHTITAGRMRMTNKSENFKIPLITCTKKTLYLCKQEIIMATNIDIDQEKLLQIMTMKQFKSKKEAVNEAISEYLKDLLRQELLKIKGSNCWEGDLDQMRLD